MTKLLIATLATAFLYSSVLAAGYISRVGWDQRAGADVRIESRQPHAVTYTQNGVMVYTHSFMTTKAWCWKRGRQSNLTKRARGAV
jgi:hypothetical protein